MSWTPLLQKMRMLAQQDATLQSYLLGTADVFRWFDTQLPKGYVYQGPTVTVQQISSVRDAVQEGPLALEQAMVQINVWSLDSVQAKTIANYLWASWFPAVSFASPAMFLSPPQAPPNHPNYLLSQRGVIDFSTQPESSWVETQTWRIFNDLSS